MYFNTIKKTIIIITILSAIAACKKTDIEEPKPTPYTLELPPFFPTSLNIPEDNPLTVEGIALGRYLFYDTLLCGNPDNGGAISCASCHAQNAGFDLGGDNPRLSNGRPVGVAGTATPHNALPLVNLVFNHEGYTWNGAIHPSAHTGQQNIEDIVAHTVTDPNEMNSSWAEALSALRTRPEYPSMFRKAFGTEDITKERVCKAIAQFVRTLISSNSKFDRYLRGETPLSDAELRGYILFSTEEGADCFHCHGSGGTPLFTTNLFYNNGMDISFSQTDDRYSITGMPQDIGAYRAPTLRNIAVSAPYMHDGRFQTLDEVLNFYNSGLQNSAYVHPYMHKINEGGAHLTPSQTADLKAFLFTLTDEELLENEKISNPFQNK